MKNQNPCAFHVFLQSRRIVPRGESGYLIGLTNLKSLQKLKFLIQFEVVSERVEKFVETEFENELELV